jgi:hypothetical protein
MEIRIRGYAGFENYPCEQTCGAEQNILIDIKDTMICIPPKISGSKLKEKQIRS